MLETVYLDKDRLRIVNRNTDWKKLFSTLGLVKDEARSKAEDWWAKSPFQEEQTASFHVNPKGFYDFASNQNGSFVELVRLLKNLDPYAAARWMLEAGVSYLPKEVGKNEQIVGEATPPTIKQLEPHENKAIKQDLLPLLTLTHPEFKQRGISKDTLTYLGAGFLDPSDSPKSQLRGRLVFQVRGLREDEEGALAPVILTHIGRAATKEDEEIGGKWRFYEGFHKTLELYNLDKLLLDEEAVKQAKETGHVLIVEGCFDAAKLIEAGIKNVVATFGAHLDFGQLPRLLLIRQMTGVSRFLVFYDRDQAGLSGTAKAKTLLADQGFAAVSFAWEMTFESPQRPAVGFPENITDPGGFEAVQLKWLRGKGVI